MGGGAVYQADASEAARVYEGGFYGRGGGGGEVEFGIFGRPFFGAGGALAGRFVVERFETADFEPSGHAEVH